jgi:hypothetical protein
VRHFLGNFDGRGHKIALAIDSSASTSAINQYIGLFGNVSGATLNNIVVDGSVNGNPEGMYGVGGIVGLASNLAFDTTTIRITITNCTNYATINGGSTSGIIGNVYSNGLVIITNCTNYGNINGNACGGIICHTGGLAGTGKITITNCTNYGNIRGHYLTGGIVG